MNYSNLSDVEFEYLCEDVMSRKLSTRLERFAPGRDGGIDLTDDAFARNIIVQVKHYVKTDTSGLIRSLKKEVAKIKEISPGQYYICCSKALTPDNKKEIYDMFSEYMASTENIITLLELDAFLESPDNVDILRKHFKLWLESTSILTDILSNDIFVDSEALLSDIEEETKFFVKTQLFEEALSCLEKRNVLIIVGNPGVGKTVTSKMLVLHYAAYGYRVRYSTDGTDLNSLKRSLSQSPETKEIILLDDCFGQAYFNMKDTQENELLALIRFVNLNSNKILIMNSRISIYHEAEDRTPNLVKSFERKEYRAYVLDIEVMSTEDKAKIFYNHLYFGAVPEEYFASIRKNKRYREIVKHANYNPRIIEFVCSQQQFARVVPTQYADFIMKCLNNPEQIWKNEYERRLGATDRILLTTLYSLSDNAVPLEMVKACFEYRISKTQTLDSSINHFEQALNRLNESMIKIVDNRNVKMLSVANPSVNDFLREYLLVNVPERQALVTNCNCVRQLKRLLNSEMYHNSISKLFSDHSILSFVFENNKQKNGFIVAWCGLNQICDEVYKPYIIDYIYNIRDINMYENQRAAVFDILDGIFDEKMCTFYQLNDLVRDTIRFHEIFENLSLEDIVEVICRIDWILDGQNRKHYIQQLRAILRESIKDYCYDIPADSYEGSIADIIEDCYSEDDEGVHIDADAAISLLENRIEDTVSDELYTILMELPPDINPSNILYAEADITVEGAEAVILNYLQDDYDDDAYYAYYEHKENEHNQDRILDYMFNRECQ